MLTNQRSSRNDRKSPLEPQGETAQGKDGSGVYAAVFANRVDAGGLVDLVFTHPLLTMSNGVSIKDLTSEWRRNPLKEAAPKSIGAHVFEAHQALKERTFPNPAVLAQTAPVSPGLAFAAWEASEEAKTAPKPKPMRKGWAVSVSTHGFKSFRVSATRFL
jgi:hypothetical protein